MTKTPDEIYAFYVEDDDGDELLIAHENPIHAGTWNDTTEVAVYKKTGTILVTNTTVITKNPSVN